MKENTIIIIKETDDYRLSATKRELEQDDDLVQVTFLREELTGSRQSHRYEMFMSHDDLDKLAQGLLT